jgi:membrane-associated phospholipid phosphatase
MTKLARAIILAWAILALICAFADLQISTAVVNPGSGWARFLDAYGQEPGLALVIVALYVVNVNREKRSGLREAVLYAGLLLCITFATDAILVKVIGGALHDLPLLRTCAGRLLALLATTALVHTLLCLRHGRFSRPTEVFAQVTVWLYLLNTVLFVQTVKTLWGRVRFRDLDALQADFTPWYLPQGITGHRSFPSGHTALGWLLLPLLLLALDRGRRAKVITGALAIAWGLLVAASRVVVGAHYASDVLFSSAVGILCFLFLYKKIATA